MSHAHIEGTVTVTITNNDTGHTEMRTLGPDDYAMLYGPNMEVLDETTNFLGIVTVRLRPKRR